MEANYFLFFKFDFMLYILGPKGTGTWFFTNEFAAKNCYINCEKTIL